MTEHTTTLHRLGQWVLAYMVLVVMACTPEETPKRRVDKITGVARHIGTKACVTCHTDEAASWRGSHHDLAMQTATSRTVLGDFDNAQFVHSGETTTFSRRDDQFLVTVTTTEGSTTEYTVAYTFGVEPLQQYLITFPDGRLQALSICWDTRPAAQGGQRWFHLQGHEEVSSTDPLHWTGALMNWNQMCGECHTTDFNRGYDPHTDQYNTVWEENNVGCEACHGPGSLHKAWAETGGQGEPQLVPLKEEHTVPWFFDGNSPIAKRATPRTSQVEVETCGRCHSRRAPLATPGAPGEPLAENYEIALLTEDLYYADGQPHDEVFVYGSFLQSKMYHAGVTCTDCHDPHSGKTRKEGDALCLQCHQTDTYAVEEHHRHPVESPGARCVSCHMPARDYMVVDPRRDHGFRVPRPDLAMRLGVPEPCTGCHEDKDTTWAAEVTANWREGKPADFHWAEALHAGRTWQPNAEHLLLRVIEETTTAPIVRASALSLLAPYLSPAAKEPVKASLSDQDPLVRRSALTALEATDFPIRLQFAEPLLIDPIGSVRTEAARILLTVPLAFWPEVQLSLRETARQQFREAQLANLDTPEAHVNLAWMHQMEGEFESAERAYRTAIERRPNYAIARINLADLYRAIGEDGKGEKVLRQGLDVLPENGGLHHALGLLLVRTKRMNEALKSLAHAAELAPKEPLYAYVYGIALHSAGERDHALKILDAAAQRFPGHRELLSGLTTLRAQSTSGK